MGSVQFQIVLCSSLYFSRSSNVVSAKCRILVCCTCHFQSSSLFFVYFGFFCLQVSSESNFHPDTRGRRWSLLQAHLFSRAVGREEHCKEISLACVGSAHSVWATPGLPPLMACVLSRSAPLRLQVALQGNYLKCALGRVHFAGLSHSGSGSRVLHKGTDSVDPASCSLPRSKQLSDQVLGEHTLPRWAVCLITSPVSAAPFPGCAVGDAFSGVPCVSSGELISACDPPGGCQPSKIPGRLG